MATNQFMSRLLPLREPLSPAACVRTNPSLPSSFVDNECLNPQQSRQRRRHIHGLPTIKRRSLTLSLFPTFLFPLSSSAAAAAAAPSLSKETTILKQYTDTAEGFTLLVPSSWTKVKKKFLSLRSNRVELKLGLISLALLLVGWESWSYSSIWWREREQQQQHWGSGHPRSPLLVDGVRDPSVCRR